MSNLPPYVPGNAASTAPWAIYMVQQYCESVAAANPALNIGVYMGCSTPSPANNFFVIGSYPDGIDPLVNFTSNWKYFTSGHSGTVTEDYAVAGYLRAWAGNIDPLGRLGDAFTMYNGLRAAIIADPGGSGYLSPSGSWGEVQMSIPENGPINDNGWGVIIAFQIHTMNIQIQGTVTNP